MNSLIPSREILSRLVLSILSAIALWSWVTLSRDPEKTAEFLSVEVDVVDLGPDMVVVGDVPSVRASYTGTRSETDALRGVDTRASVDLSGIDEPGSYTLDVRVDKPADIWSTASDPSRLTVQVERRMSDVFPVNPSVSGILSSNQQIGLITPSEGEVVVSGPESSVSQVRTINLPVDIENRTSNFVGVFTPIAVDAAGQPIGGVTLNPDTISAEVQITARGKQLAVISQITGAPASGYEIVERAINPITVLVDGPPEILDSLITVSTLPVNVSGEDGDVTQRVRLADLPPGVSIVEPSSGFVDVVIQIRPRGVQQSLPSQPVTVLNLGAGLVADVSPGVVLVNVQASEQQLLDLAPENLQVEVDVEGRGPGTYTLQPRVVVPATLEWLSIAPETVTVTIRTQPGSSEPGTPPATPVIGVEP